MTVCKIKQNLGIPYQCFTGIFYVMCSFLCCYLLVPIIINIYTEKLQMYNYYGNMYDNPYPSRAQICRIK